VADKTYRENRIQFAIRGLKCRRRQQITRPIPPDILDTLKVIGDLGNRRRDDRLIEGHQKDSTAQGKQDDGQLDAVGIVRVLAVQVLGGDAAEALFAGLDTGEGAGLMVVAGGGGGDGLLPTWICLVGCR
jgi:hypothetical protein